jgi:hypothetical protein
LRNFALIHKGQYEFPGRWQLSGQDDAVAAM